MLDNTTNEKYIILIAHWVIGGNTRWVLCDDKVLLCGYINVPLLGRYWDGCKLVYERICIVERDRCIVRTQIYRKLMLFSLVHWPCTGLALVSICSGSRSGGSILSMVRLLVRKHKLQSGIYSRRDRRDTKLSIMWGVWVRCVHTSVRYKHVIYDHSLNVMCWCLYRAEMLSRGR
jgi:hypothetical protein